MCNMSCSCTADMLDMSFYFVNLMTSWPRFLHDRLMYSTAFLTAPHSPAHRNKTTDSCCSFQFRVF